MLTALAPLDGQGHACRSVALALPHSDAVLLLQKRNQAGLLPQEIRATDTHYLLQVPCQVETFPCPPGLVLGRGSGKALLLLPPPPRTRLYKPASSAAAAHPEICSGARDFAGACGTVSPRSRATSARAVRQRGPGRGCPPSPLPTDERRDGVCDRSC